ncbi:MAG TPA: response regulator [Bacteroidia bacterium]|nr:response regulator [Bacteroidia bacterium]
MKKILVIEDNPVLRENIAEILGVGNYEVIAAGNGKTGLGYAAKNQPDLILCDISMPEMDGFEVRRVLGNRMETAGIPFIFLSANADKESRRTGMSLGADDYITKPFDAETLLEIVRVRIERREQTRRQTEKELLHYVSALEEMLEMVSHRVRKPLCTCLGLIQLLEKGDGGILNSSELQKVITHVRSSTGELDDFTRELTTFMQEERKRILGKLDG